MGQRKKKEPWRGAVIINRGGRELQSFQVIAGEQTADQVHKDAERLRLWLGGDEIKFEREGDSEVAE